MLPAKKFFSVLVPWYNRFCLGERVNFHKKQNFFNNKPPRKTYRIFYPKSILMLKHWEILKITENIQLRSNNVTTDFKGQIKKVSNVSHLKGNKIVLKRIQRADTGFRPAYTQVVNKFSIRHTVTIKGNVF